MHSKLTYLILSKQLDVHNASYFMKDERIFLGFEQQEFKKYFVYRMLEETLNREENTGIQEEIKVMLISTNTF